MKTLLTVMPLAMLLGLAGCYDGPTYAQLQEKLHEDMQRCAAIPDETLANACMATTALEERQLAVQETADILSAPSPLPSAPVAMPFPTAPTFAPPPMPPVEAEPDSAPVGQYGPSVQPMPRFVPVVPGPATGASGGGLLAP